MKDTAILFIIACIFIALVATQIAISTTDTISVNVRDTESSFDIASSETLSTIGNEFININTATVELLCQIKGIGEVRAESIIEYRESNGPFTCVEDLLKVKGIGEGTLEKMKPYITV